MELTVLVNEQEKNVSGITEDTTCSDIIYALAHSSGQKGKFVLVAHINGMEYKFFPQEKPLSVIKCDKISNKPVHTTFELRNVSSYSTDPSKHNQIQNNNNVISKAQTLSRPNHSTHNNGEAIYSHHQILRPVMLGHQNTTNIQQHPNSGNSNVVRNIVTGLNSLERPPPPVDE
uniref:Ras-associating domain-containing protein n=1 Tax=Rhabditophanes sp. KR3021 TaxID=114890 RepID=A0AC35U8B0_9BILA